MMTKNVFTKTFDSEEELKRVINECVGTCYWQVRPHWVNIDGLTVVIAFKSSGYKKSRKEMLFKNGFTFERKKVA